MDFSSPEWRTASAAVHLIGASMLAFCLASRLHTINITRKNWTQIPWARWCILLVFIDSWIFHVYAGLLIQGYGLSQNEVTCGMAIYICIVIYCLSKILIYLFLIERIYVVWPHAGTRLSSKAYCVCMLMMVGYAAISVDMVIGRNTYFQGDNCMIGLKPFASIPLLSYDLFLNTTLTSMFLWPLHQAHFRDPRLRKIAHTTLIASIIALTTSSINMVILTIKHGVELGWICLASCGLDVTINALVIYAITGYKPEEHSNYLTNINFSIPLTTHSIVFTPRNDAEAPHLTLPAPVQDTAKPYRAALGIPNKKPDSADTKRNPSLDHPQSDSYYVIRDRGTDYPHAHIETVESVRYERRIEGVSPGFGIPLSYWWSRCRWPESWKRQREVERFALQVNAQPAPCQIQVQQIQQIQEISRQPPPWCVYSASAEESDEMRDSIGH